MQKTKRPATYIEDIKAFRSSFASTLTKFENPSTRRSTLDEVKEVIFNQVQDPERVALVVKMVLDLNEHQQSAAKKEYIKLLGILAEVLKDRLLEHIPKLLTCIIKKLKESDALLNETIAESVGSIFENVVSTIQMDEALQQSILISRNFFQLASSGSKNTQIGAALSISKILQSCPLEVMVEFADEIIPRIVDMLGSSGCKAHLQYFECILSLLLALEDNREKVVEVAQTFQPIMISGMGSEEWTVRKISVDTVYYCIEKDLFDNREDILQALHKIRTDKIKNVRDIVSTTLAFIKEKYGERKSHNSDSPNQGDSRNGSPNRKSSPGRKPLAKNPNFFKGMKKEGPLVEVYTVLSPKKPEKGGDDFQSVAKTPDKKAVQEKQDRGRNPKQVASPEFVSKEQPKVFNNNGADLDRVSFGIPKPENVKTQNKRPDIGTEEQLLSMRSQEEKRFSPPHASIEIKSNKESTVPNKSSPSKKNHNERMDSLPTDFSDTAGCFASIFLQLKKLSKQQLKLTQSFAEHQELTMKEMNGLKEKILKIEDYLRSYPPQPQILYHPYALYNPQQQAPLLQQAIITQPQQVYPGQQPIVLNQQQPIYQPPIQQIQHQQVQLQQQHQHHPQQQVILQQNQQVQQQQQYIKSNTQSSQQTQNSKPQLEKFQPSIQNLSPIPSSANIAHNKSHSQSQAQLNNFLQNQIINVPSSQSFLSTSVKDEPLNLKKKKPNKPPVIDTSKNYNQEPVKIVERDQNDQPVVCVITSDSMDFACDLMSYVFSNQGVECEMVLVEDPIMCSNPKSVFFIIDALGPSKPIIHEKYQQYLEEYGTKLKVIYLLEESLSEDEVKEILSTCTGDHIGLRYQLNNDFDDSTISLKKGFVDEQEATNLIDFLTQFC